MPTTRGDAAALDSAAGMTRTRERFHVPAGVIYLDGNSLGALPVGVGDRLADVVAREWGDGLIRSWNDARWMELAGRIAARIAPLVGAHPADLQLGDSTSVSLFKTMVAAARLRPGRKVIVVEPTTFPTDGYIAAGVADLLGLELRWCNPAHPLASVDRDVALLSLTHVDFRTGAMYDMAPITAGAQARGALVQWDLCHSAGAVPVDLTEAGADFAVGCTYKYLNGGPGSPGWIYVARRHHDLLDLPLTGWQGHAVPFDLEQSYRPAEGIERARIGTPPVLSMTALDAALDVFDDVEIRDVRAKSLRLSQLVIDYVDAHLADVTVMTPRDPERRGSQVSLAMPHAYEITQALIARGVIGDFRAPDMLRLGFAAPYLGFAQVWDAMASLTEVLATESWRDPQFARGNTAVT